MERGRNQLPLSSFFSRSSEGVRPAITDAFQAQHDNAVVEYPGLHRPIWFPCAWIGRRTGAAMA